MLPMRQPNGIATIDLHLRAISQLFRTEDPFPFRDSDLARQAEDYLLLRAKQAPKRQPIRITINLAPSEYARDSHSGVAARIATGFSDLAQAEASALGELFSTGRRALAIGVAVLSLCLLLAVSVAARIGEGPLSNIVQESAVIFGWVAIWKPAEIFLYGWLPMVRRLALLRRLAAAEITLRSDAAII